MDDLSERILRLWDRGCDTHTITRCLNARKGTQYRESEIHRLLICARERRSLFRSEESNSEKVVCL